MGEAGTPPPQQKATEGWRQLVAEVDLLRSTIAQLVAVMGAATSKADAAEDKPQIWLGMEEWPPAVVVPALGATRSSATISQAATRPTVAIL
ncbi:unnamed protein product [Lampetra fluviatilis]